MIDKDSAIDPPQSPTALAQTLEAVVRAALSAVPFVGGAGVELFQAVVNSGRQERMQRWIESVSETLARHDVTLESLVDNDGFLDAIGPATRAAVETSSAEKVEALQNAVLNATIAPDTAADRHAILMDIVVTLTPTHVKLLRLFDDPLRWYADTGTTPRSVMGGQGLVVQDAYPGLAADSVLLRQAVADLKRYGLSDIALDTMMTEQGVYSSRTQPLGALLLQFITEPAA